MFVLPGKSFRDEQCEKYNSDRYLDIHGNIKQWIPKYNGVSPRDRCKLFCRARGSNEFKVFEAKVAITRLKFEIVPSWLK
jgi:thrombospondin motif-containing protein 8